MNQVHYFTVEETEAQSSSETCPRSASLGQGKAKDGGGGWEVESTLEKAQDIKALKFKFSPQDASEAMQTNRDVAEET